MVFNVLKTTWFFYSRIYSHIVFIFNSFQNCNNKNSNKGLGMHIQLLCWEQGGLGR